MIGEFKTERGIRRNSHEVEILSSWALDGGGWGWDHRTPAIELTSVQAREILQETLYIRACVLKSRGSRHILTFGESGQCEEDAPRSTGQWEARVPTLAREHVTVWGWARNYKGITREECLKMFNVAEVYIAYGLQVFQRL